MKNSIFGIALGILVGLAIGYYAFHGPTVSYVQGVSSAGVSGSTERFYTITMVPLGASATTTSMLNTDGTDRAITSSTAYCTGVGTSQTFTVGTGLASLLIQMSTSTVGGLGLQGNANFAANLTVPTSSPWSYVAASTTEAVTPSGRVWPTGTYLNITFNATNTASCTVGVRTIPL